MQGAIGGSDRPEDVALRYMREAPPTDVMGLAAELGIGIEYQQLGDMSGKIEKRLEGQPRYIITLNSEHGLNRQRFTLAHEIAHFIKHRRHLDAGGIMDNALYRSLLPEPMEWEANKYAAQLLMPLSSMQKLWKMNLRSPVEFAQHLGVSEAAAQIRLDQVKGSLAVGDLFG